MCRSATEEKTSDFRRRTSAGLRGRCMRRPRGGHVVGSRKSEVTIRGSGTPAASALARHCEATGVSLPRGWRAADDETNGTCGTNGTVGSARGLPPASFPAKSNGMLVAFMRVLESADGAGIHCADPAQEAQVALAALQAFAQRKARNGMNALSYTAEHIHKGLLLCDNPRVRQADFLKLNRFRKKKGK